MPCLRINQIGVLLVACALAGGAARRIEGAEIAASEKLQFNRDIRPILAENCFYCHGRDSNKRKAGLRLDVRELATKAVESGGIAIVPGDVGRSELVTRIFSVDPDEQMPPAKSNRALTPQQKATLKRWIAEGANYEAHWAYTAPVRSELPSVQDSAWPRNPIDRFVLAKLEQDGLKPSPEADRATLIRRLSLDLIGLPPTPAEADAFVADTAPDAYEKLVDRLMSSEHYGERMALPWLDAARYADSNGFQQDGDTFQWLWRDWVVRALNSDMPYDRFSIEQLAGDLLPTPTTDQLIATAFNRNHLLNGEGGAIAEEQRYNILFDRVDTTATTWLGLTVACAECHDHKFDPVTQRDYYSLLAAFNQVSESGLAGGGPGAKRVASPFIELRTDEDKAHLAELESQQTKIDAEGLVKQKFELALAAWMSAATPETRRAGKNLPLPTNLTGILRIKPDKRTATQQQQVEKGLRSIFQDEVWPIVAAQDPIAKHSTELASEIARAKKEEMARVMVMRDDKPRDTFMLDRGNYLKPKEKVTFATPEFLPPLPKDAPRNRLGFARWLFLPEQPLTARVQINRMWQLFFGIGLVKTAEDLGVQSEFPPHQNLLDWLAVEFRESGWSMKHVTRLIVTSATYRQSSRVTPELLLHDPENRLLSRAARFRLPAMILRDVALSASDLLDTRVGGKPVYPYQPEGVWESLAITHERDFTYPTSTGRDLYRRSLYTFWRRTLGPANMFDASARQTCRVRTAITDTPLHALTTLNDPTWTEAARVLAAHSLEANGGVDQRLVFAFRRVLGRKPNPKELAMLHKAYEEQYAIYKAEPKSAAAVVSIGAGSEEFASRRRRTCGDDRGLPGDFESRRSADARVNPEARTLMLNQLLLNQQRVTRRQLFGTAAQGIGAIALASLFGERAATGAQPGLVAQPGLIGLPHFAPKAKRVVCLWQGGGPTHVDLFDPKPILTKMAGQDIPESVRGATRLSTMSAGYKKWPITPAIKPFKRYGQCGTEMSAMLPNIGALADDICLVRSMNTEAVNHAPGVTFFMTGAQVPGRPSMGAWLSYGLGCESSDLPAFVAMTSSDKAKTCGQLFYDYYWGSGFLPSRFQGVRLGNVGDPVPYLKNPDGMSRAERRTLLDDLRAMNEAHLRDYGDPEIDTRIAQYEMAYKMQASVPDLLDFSSEPKHVVARYGPDALVKGTFANNCLIARRLLERGVRFVQLMHAGWDQHNNLFTQLEVQCRDTDAPSAALVWDLKERGLLDDTLVVWGGEFGRTPFGQGDPAKPNGRDHFGRAYAMWLAGGGVRGGATYGSTDDFAWNIARDPVHVHDMQATILHLCGINHEAFTYRYQGRQFRLTDVSGQVVKGIVA